MAYAPRITVHLRRGLKPAIYLLRRLLGLVVGTLLPNRGKRIVFAASLYTHLHQSDPTEMDEEQLREYLSEINRLFQLTGTEERALLMPLYFHKSIWGAIELPDEESLRKRSVQNNCDALLRKIPHWMRYDQKVMKDDAMIILRASAGRHVRLSHR